jgi:glycosyltransferase involved in cell wall biosynthesis
MPPRFLLGCYEVPGWGGAATVSYALFRRMQAEGFDVSYVNLVEAHDVAMLAERFGPQAGNPDALPNVATLTLAPPLWRAHAELAALIEAQRPDLLVARGYIGALLMKEAAPHVPLVFLTSGCAQIKRLLRAGVIEDFVDFERLLARGVQFHPPTGDREQRAVAGSDLIIVHSPLVRTAFEHFFPSSMGTVYANTISVADDVAHHTAPFRRLARRFAERDIDVLFVASNWRRTEKNYPLLRRIAAACRDLRVHVVGDLAPDDLAVERHGVIAARGALLGLMGRAKVVVSPSSWDPAPGVLFEAAAMGCNVVASRNCGNWALCNEALLATSAGEFTACVRRGLAAPLPQYGERFAGGYADLIETLQAFV